MEHKSYEKHKIEFDKKVFNYLAKRLLDDVKHSDAAKSEVIDGVGNLLRDVKHGEDWVLTDLDRLVLMLKHAVGQPKIDELLSGHSHLKDIDSVVILNSAHDSDIKKMHQGIKNIISCVEDRSFLPEYHYRSEGEYIDDENDDGIDLMSDRASKSFTLMSYLLYALRHERMPNKTDFEYNICPSTEITFSIKPLKSFEDISSYAMTHGLMGSGGVTKEGLRLMASAAKHMVSHKLLHGAKKRVENQSKNWERMASI